MSDTPSPERRIFTQKRERTRAQLIEVAAAMIAGRGFEATSLRDVAARAGLTKGAIYGIFDSKEDLFLAVVRAKLPRRGPVFEPGLPLRAQLRRLAERIIAMAPDAQSQARLSIEFELYLMTHDSMRARMSTAYVESHRQAEDEIRAAVDEAELPLPPGEFAVLIAALTGGVLHRRFVIPEVMTDALIVRLFEALAPAGPLGDTVRPDG
jgi:AcrR family transcriptional regulator